jgi:hypothetical protein
VPGGGTRKHQCPYEIRPQKMIKGILGMPRRYLIPDVKKCTVAFKQNKTCPTMFFCDLMERLELRIKGKTDCH